MPCTSYDVGEVTTFLPAAFCILASWLFGGRCWPVHDGRACGSLVLLPVFLALVPLWFAYYERRRGVFCRVAGCRRGAFRSVSWHSLPGSLRVFGPASGVGPGGGQGVHGRDNYGRWGRGRGFWEIEQPGYRIPVMSSSRGCSGVDHLAPNQTLEHLSLRRRLWSWPRSSGISPQGGSTCCGISRCCCWWCSGRDWRGSLPAAEPGAGGMSPLVFTCRLVPGWDPADPVVALVAMGSTRSGASLG
ncbi:MAG: hypothetical protein Ct9H300mP1_24520 [Planctomycetaceae bacterium]|nr:MAG: hypothetical protein Ct9H300mP1_24520 [Planctomycetaceae bacterium]